MSQNIKIKGKNSYDVLTFTLTQKCFACFNIEGIWWSIQIPFTWQVILSFYLIEL